MKKVLSVLICFSIIFSCLGISAYESKVRTYHKNKKYIVILEAPPVYSDERISTYGVSDDMYRQALLELQQEIKWQIPVANTFSLDREETTKEYAYTDLINGFTVTCNSCVAEIIKEIDGVKCVFEDFTFNAVEMPDGESLSEVQATTGESATKATYSSANAGNMINVQQAYQKGYDGTGRAIAIIDSGIDVNHEFYTIKDKTKAKYSKNDISSIISSGNFNVSATVNDAYINEKIPFAYCYADDDVQSMSDAHGGHVAGIAAGGSVAVDDGIISGIAPEAQILFFGVFDSETGDAPYSIVAAAMEDAVKFDVDSVNLSLGTDRISENIAWSSYQEAVKNLQNAGVSVQFAAGNSDKMSYQATFSDYSTSDNRNYKNSSKVASIQNKMAYMSYLEDENGTKYGCGVKGVATQLGAIQIVDCGFGTEAEFVNKDVKNKIAVVTVPDPYVAESISLYGKRAITAGAKAVVIVNNSIDATDGNAGFPYPLFYVSGKDGADILANATTLKFENKNGLVTRTEESTANKFSSYSYSDNLEISVDYAAVGGNIYSAYGSGKSFASLSGTSMAAPQATGAASLMHQYVESAFSEYEGKNKVMLIKNLLSSTAETVYRDGVLESVRKVGSGLIKLDKAMESKVILKGKNTEETRVTLGEIGKQFYVKFTAYNLGDSEITFNSVGVELSTDDYKLYDTKGYGTCGLKKLTATVDGADSVTIPPQESCDVTLSVTLSDEDITYLDKAMKNGFFVDGKVTLSGAANNCDVGIPFMGFYGSWCKMAATNNIVANAGLSVVDMYDFAVHMSLLVRGSSVVLPVSETPDSYYDDARFYIDVHPLRNAYLTVKIDGEEILNDEFINKGYLNSCELTGLTAEALAGASLITLEYRLPYDTEGSNINRYNISIIKDSQPPSVSDIFTSTEEGETYSNVVVSDDYFVSVTSMMATETATNDTIIYDAYIDEKEAQVLFPIDGIAEPYYVVYGGSLNISVVAPEVVIYTENDTAYFRNNTLGQVTGICMIAVYENGKMTECTPLAESKTLDMYSYASFDLSEYNGKEYKLFYWKDINSTYEPVCDNYSTFD